MRPVRLFALGIAATLVQVWGFYWDLSWHIEFGERSLFSPPHVTWMSGVLLATTAGWLDVRGSRLTAWPRLGRIPLLFFGACVEITGFFSDALWHYHIGPDLVWSPPHFVIATGVLIELMGCLALPKNSAPLVLSRTLMVAPFLTFATALMVFGVFIGSMESRLTHRSLLLYPIAMGFVASAVLGMANRFLAGRWIAVKVAAIYFVTRGAPALFLWLMGSLVSGYPPFLVLPALLMDLVVRPGKNEMARTAIGGALFGACLALVEYYPIRIASEYPWALEALWGVIPFAAAAGLYGALWGYLAGNLLSRASLVPSVS